QANHRTEGCEDALAGNVRWARGFIHSGIFLQLLFLFDQISRSSHITVLLDLDSCSAALYPSACRTNLIRFVTLFVQLCLCNFVYATLCIVFSSSGAAVDSCSVPSREIFHALYHSIRRQA